MRKDKIVLSSLIKTVSTVNGVTRTVARNHCLAFFNAIKTQLVEDQEVCITNLFILRMRHKKERKSYNPGTGLIGVIPARNTATIRVSPNLVNGSSIVTGTYSKFFNYASSKGIPVEVTAVIVKELATAIKNQVQIEIRGFGSIHYTHLPERTVRNPQTGEQSIASPLNKTLFRLSPELLKMLNVGNPAFDK